MQIEYSLDSSYGLYIIKLYSTFLFDSFLLAPGSEPVGSAYARA